MQSMRPQVEAGDAGAEEEGRLRARRPLAEKGNGIDRGAAQCRSITPCTVVPHKYLCIHTITVQISKLPSASSAAAGAEQRVPWALAQRRLTLWGPRLWAARRSPRALPGGRR